MKKFILGVGSILPILTPLVISTSASANEEEAPRRTLSTSNSFSASESEVEAIKNRMLNNVYNLKLPYYTTPKSLEAKRDELLYKLSHYKGEFKTKLERISDANGLNNLLDEYNTFLSTKYRELYYKAVLLKNIIEITNDERVYNTFNELRYENIISKLVNVAKTSEESIREKLASLQEKALQIETLQNSLRELESANANTISELDGLKSLLLSISLVTNKEELESLVVKEMYNNVKTNLINLVNRIETNSSLRAKAEVRHLINSSGILEHLSISNVETLNEIELLHQVLTKVVEKLKTVKNTSVIIGGDETNKQSSKLKALSYAIAGVLGAAITLVICVVAICFVSIKNK